MNTVAALYPLRFKPTGARRVHAGRRIRVYEREVKSACGEWYVPEEPERLGLVDDPVTCKACRLTIERPMSRSQRFVYEKDRERHP